MYILLALSVLSASLNSVLLNKSGASKSNTVFEFNVICSIVWCVLLFFANNCKLNINLQVIIWGTMYGVAQTCFLIFKTVAMRTGSVSVTTLIGNSSLLISTFASLIIWNEPITIADAIGLLLLCVSIFLCTYKKGDAQYSPKWKYYTLFFFLFATSVGLIFKGFGKSGNLEYCGDMMFFSAIIMTCSNFIISCVVKKQRDASRTGSKAKREFLIFALSSGVLSCLYNRLNIFLAGSIDGVVFFPCFNGGVVLLSTFLSIMIF